MRRRRGLGLGVTIGALGASGVLLLSIAADGAGPAAYPVVLGGSSAPVTPVTASPSAGQDLVFVNSGNAPYVVTRTATPFAFATTIGPSSASTPLTVPTAQGSYPYTAQLRQPDNILGMAGSAGPTISAQVVVSPLSSVAPIVPGPSTAAPTAAPVAPTATTAAPVLRSSPGRRSPAPSKSQASSSPRASASASATSTAIQPGGLLPQPAEPPLFSDGAAVPLPVLPTAGPTAASVPSPATSEDAGVAPSAPLATASATPLAVGPIAANAPRMGPRRSRGLPIALALALLLGVGGAVGRTLARTRRTP